MIFRTETDLFDRYFREYANYRTKFRVFDTR